MDLFKKKQPTEEELQEQKRLEDIAKGNINVQKEFQSWLQTVHNIAKDPLLNREQKRSGLRQWIDKLSELAYTTYFYEFMKIIQAKKENCMEYENVEEQTKSILDWLPRLRDHEELVKLIIKERREKYKLKV